MVRARMLMTEIALKYAFKNVKIPMQLYTLNNIKYRFVLKKLYAKKVDINF